MKMIAHIMHIPDHHKGIEIPEKPSTEISIGGRVQQNFTAMVFKIYLL